MTKISFNKPYMTGKELLYIAQAHANRHLAGDGPFTKRCHRWLEDATKTKKAFLTHSCTAALEMTAILSGIQPGDEVIMPSYTFVSTANAFVLQGGVPVFVDIRPDTLNMDENLIEAAITGRTKAIVPVHYAGVACEMDRIKEIAARHDLLVIEDASQGIMSSYKGRALGSIGHFGTLSFHETKNIISGEGGALLVNDKRFIERAENVWEKGTNRRKFLRGQVDKYTWVDIGSSYLPGELVAAFLFAQLEHAEDIAQKRRNIYRRYRNSLLPLVREGKIVLPAEQNEHQSNGHITCILTKSLNERNQLLTYLNDKGVNAIFHYVPLHSSPAGRRFGRIAGDMKITNDISKKLLRLPMYYEMSSDDIDYVIQCVKQYYDKNYPTN